MCVCANLSFPRACSTIHLPSGKAAPTAACLQSAGTQHQCTSVTQHFIILSNGGCFIYTRVSIRTSCQRRKLAVQRCAPAAFLQRTWCAVLTKGILWYENHTTSGPKGWMKRAHRHSRHTRISPVSERLHHRYWELMDGKEKKEERRLEKEKAKGKERGRRWKGLRERRGRGVWRTKCCEKWKNTARVKAEARFTSPRIPTSFYRPLDDWVRLSGGMATDFCLVAAQR